MSTVLASALVLQHALGWLPCPLCILQRLTGIGLLASLVVLGAARQHGWRVGALAVASAFALAGSVAGGAHLWLLAQPETGSCAPGLARMVGQLVDALPGSAWLLEGAGACEDVRYKIFGLPLPLWSVAAHLAALGLGAAAALNPRSQECN